MKPRILGKKFNEKFTPGFFRRARDSVKDNQNWSDNIEIIKSLTCINIIINPEKPATSELLNRQSWREKTSQYNLYSEIPPNNANPICLATHTLAAELKLYTRSSNTFIKNYSYFIKQTELQPQDLVVSSDVTSLITLNSYHSPHEDHEILQKPSEVADTFDRILHQRHILNKTISSIIRDQEQK